jgi:hypothetical protein
MPHMNHQEGKQDLGWLCTTSGGASTTSVGQWHIEHKLG